jgi:hypothetical protein
MRGSYGAASKIIPIAPQSASLPNSPKTKMAAFDLPEGIHKQARIRAARNEIILPGAARGRLSSPETNKKVWFQLVSTFSDNFLSG